jgi:hypothetical protein
MPVARKNAQSVWARARACADALAYWPIICNARDEELLFQEDLDPAEHKPESIIAAGLEMERLPTR